jgi:hypothetical protein
MAEELISQATQAQGGSVVGCDYTYQNGKTTDASTRRKLKILEKKDPAQAKAVASILGIADAVGGSAESLSDSINKASNSLDKYTRNLVQTLFSQELAVAKSVGKLSNSISGGIDQGVEGLSDGLDAVSKDLNELFKPVSTALGSTLGTLTGMAKDPLGSVTALPRTLADVVERVSPKFAATIEASYKKIKLDNLAHIPTQVMGGIKNLMTAADALLALPLQIVSDLYQGLMDIMKSISDAVDQIISMVINFFFGPGGLLDSILPISQIMAFLEAISELASEIGGIAGTFLSSNPISGFANSVQGYASQVGSILQNPTDLITSYMPEQVTQGLYAIRNPQTLVNQILPPELSEKFATLSKITGFGFNGNMGFGFESVLEGLKGGVISSILTNFAKQYKILTPLLGLEQGSVLNPPTTPQLTPALAGGQPTAQGIVQPQQIPEKPIADNTSASSSGGTSGTPEVRRAIPV